MTKHAIVGRLAILSLIGAMAVSPSARATLIWDWSYSGTGFSAGGTLQTTDTPDGSGFYPVIGIAGVRNGVAITGLQPAGTAIPGNEPFAVDDLIRASPEQLTGDGIGFSTADGNFANIFFASFLAPPGYVEFFSAPPFTPGVTGPEDHEVPVLFSAAPRIPEPASFVLLLSGLAAAGVARRRRGN